MKKRRLVLFTCLAAALTVDVPAEQGDGEVRSESVWEIRSETVYSTGTYGGDIRTDVLYAPLEIRRKFEWGELGIAIPYLWYRSDGTFTFINEAATPQIQAFRISESAQGMTDLLLDAKYRHVSQSGNRPEVLLRGYWKPPTANEAKGLSTGTHDWLLGTEFWGWLPGSQQWFYFGDLYRYFPGGSSSTTVRDSWIYDIGVGGLITDNFLAKLSYKEQTSVTPGLPSAQLAVIETEFKINSDLKILSGFSLGLSDAAPDLIVMLGFERSF